jgi:hypothetical protein
VGHEAVVTGVGDGGMEDAVEDEHAGVFIVFKFVGGEARDLDDARHDAGGDGFVRQADATIP